MVAPARDCATSLPHAWSPAPILESYIKQTVWIRAIHEPFILAALALALTSGFGYGALLVGALALGVIPGAWYAPTVQAHGHTQLFGWLGLFILGMALYFLPRLRGEKLRRVERAPWAYALLAFGIPLRTLSQPALGFWTTSDNVRSLLRVLFALSGVLELAGIVLIASMLIATVRGAKPISTQAPAYPVLPFVSLALISLALAFVLNLLGVLNAVLDGHTTLAARYDQLIIQLWLYGVAIPMAIVFSIRNLPLFMRLAMPPRRPIRLLGIIYSTALLLRLLPFILAILDDALRGNAALPFAPLITANYLNVLVFDALAAAGGIILNVCILLFIVQLDLLRLRPPWIVDRAPDTRPDLAHLRKPTRPNYPDNGEYGRFELLIYSAYTWLAIAVILDLLRVIGSITGNLTVPQDAARHAFAVGFVTLLIFGMAARMVPGFSHKKGLAHPELVLWTFVLGNLAAVLRVVPTFFPQSELALMLWGLSGIVGWGAVLVLGINLLGTLRQ